MCKYSVFLIAQRQKLVACGTQALLEHRPGKCYPTGYLLHRYQHNISFFSQSICQWVIQFCKKKRCSIDQQNCITFTWVLIQIGKTKTCEDICRKQVSTGQLVGIPKVVAKGRNREKFCRIDSKIMFQ